MTTLFATAVAGLAGTILMSLVMTFIHRTGWANADMIRALGSLVTRRYDGAVKPGLFIHLVSGIAFAFPYAIVLRGTGIASNLALPGLGILLGLFHGVAVSFALLALVAENHPVERFQEPGFEVAAAHVLGHLAYGLGVGTIVWLLHIDFGIRF